MKIHPVFHVSLLTPVKPDIFGREPERPPPVVTPEEEEEYEVEEVLNSRRQRKQLQYLIQWEGYRPDSNSWERAYDVRNAPEKVEEFHRQYPHVPRP